ncbi:prepilin-type N-terminal cleavage/methylation domain-containing protein [Duganella sp. BJB1802]|uniref:prepilin-type N-terminal cleavage/methylation domain-containing protein n=1 Tax=Duganella sp. BJB1802 TaxID=2744575 RepID=UPI00159410A8|nr:prepilin-type N-terminal cleavage/methylation domain-containing protein [Duganella sp. BJB1802]NVD69705.1 prepilin-type N-terminal cleavage/methylation domain-containing protein [Duganella sp. BJB1802]
MFQLTPPARRPQRGLTLLELLLTLTIFAFMLAIGIPNASNWLLSNRARSASEFYADGFSLARRQAVMHNSFSRISLSPNVNSGQMDWQVDICFVSPATQCGAAETGWSTVNAPAANDPEGAAGYKSVYRAAESLPNSEVLLPSTQPEGSSQVYYTPIGWVDTRFAQRLTSLRLDPAAKYANEVPVVALVVTLAGMASKCDPRLPASDTRACPP